MSASEFALWQAYALVSPIDDERMFDVGTAMVCQLLATIHRKPGSEPPSLSEFLPFHPRPKFANSFEHALLAWAKKKGSQG